jgi:hypothetical protein
VVRLATVVSLGALVRAALHLRPFTGCLWAVIFIVISGLAAGLATAGVITGPGASELVQWSVVGAIAAVAYPPGGAVTFAFGFLIAVGLVSEGPVTVAGSLAVVGSIVFAFAVRWANSTPIWRQRQGTFLIAFFASAVLACLVLAGLRSSLPNWNVTGPLVLFFGLLTLIDAALDWASLGLARALLRRGLELGGRWPYALALVNAALAAFVIAALALIMVVGVQAFDALAVHGGGAPTLPLEPLFNRIAKHPSLPEYWWFYAVLLSTMIPILVNLVIGGTALVSGLPGVPSMALRYIPARGGVLKWNRRWIATVLTGQVAAGAALGIAAQVFLIVVIIGYVLPFFGLELLDMARDVATFNLPARVGQIFGVSL